MAGDLELGSAGTSDSSSFDMEGALDDISSGLGLDDDVVENTDGISEVTERVEGESAAAAVAQPAPEGEADPAAGDATPADTVVKTAPKTWRAEAAAEWAKLSPVVQAEIEKREADIFSGIEALKPDAHIGKVMKGVLAPYVDILAHYNIDPARQVQSLMQSHYTLATGTPEAKITLIRELARDYGIDLEAVRASDPLQDEFVDPQVKAVLQKLATVESQLAGYEQQATNQTQVDLRTQIETFSKSPDVPFFKEVAGTMAKFLTGGLATDLRDAYDKACRYDPVVAGKIAAQATAVKAEAERKAAAERVAKARGATAASVRTTARSGNVTATLGSMDDTFAETLAAIKARGN